MRKPSAETQLRRAKSELKRRCEETRVAVAKADSMLIGVTKLSRMIGVTRGALPANDQWRGHFEFWISELEAIKKIGFGSVR